MIKTLCPCCSHITIEDEFDICPVCYWENDPIQVIHPDYDGGANNMSLNNARLNYLSFGASDEEFLRFVRKPLNNE